MEQASQHRPETLLDSRGVSMNQMEPGKAGAMEQVRVQAARVVEAREKVRAKAWETQ